MYLPVGGTETVGLQGGDLEEHGSAAGVHLDSGQVQCSVYMCTVYTWTVHSVHLESGQWTSLHM